MQEDNNEILQEKDSIDVMNKSIEENKPKKKNKKKKVIIAIIIILLIALSIGLAYYFFIYKDNNTKEINTENKIMKTEYTMKGNDLQKFDLAFLKLENEKVNKIYSPLSIKYALEMLSTGANGESKSQIDSVIGDYKATKYTNDSHMSFANAMFIKDSFKDSVKSSYTDILKDKFNAEVKYDSFKNASNINNWVSEKTFKLIDNLVKDPIQEDFFLINALAIDMEWVKKIKPDVWKDSYSVEYKHENYKYKDEGAEYEGTYELGVCSLDSCGYSSVEFNNNGRIKEAKTSDIAASVNRYDLVSKIGEENIRATVKEAYDKYLKEDEYAEPIEDFDAYLDEYIKDIDANYNQISSSTDFMFYDDENVKVFAKDLKEYNGTTLEYVGIMPKQEKLDNYIKNIDEKKLNEIIKNLIDTSKIENFDDNIVTRITGEIPLFNFEYELSLMDDLKALGIKNVFDSKYADLSNLTSSKGEYINSTKHKANIEFSNDGIKASAATSLGGAGNAGGGFDYLFDIPVKEIDLTFDNPYMFLIRDKKTGEVWFVGTVYEPLDACKNNDTSCYEIQ